MINKVIAEPPRPANVDLKPLNDIKLMNTTTSPTRNIIQPEIPTAAGFYPNSPPPYVNRSQPNGNFVNNNCF